MAEQLTSPAAPGYNRDSLRRSTMPIHDWTRVEAGVFHHFHPGWVVAIGNALNGGRLPPGYMAMVEQVTGRPIPDVVTLQAREPGEGPEGGIAVATAPPSARVIARMER